MAQSVCISLSQTKGQRNTPEWNDKGKQCQRPFPCLSLTNWVKHHSYVTLIVCLILQLSKRQDKGTALKHPCCEISSFISSHFLYVTFNYRDHKLGDFKGPSHTLQRSVQAFESLLHLEKHFFYFKLIVLKYTGKRHVKKIE